MTDNKNNDIIENAYNQFYGSIANTLKEARKVDKSIKYDDVKNWFDNKFVRKKQLSGYNSFVASYPKQEYQLVLYFVNDLGDQESKICL